MSRTTPAMNVCAGAVPPRGECTATSCACSTPPKCVAPYRCHTSNSGHTSRSHSHNGCSEPPPTDNASHPLPNSSRSRCPGNVPKYSRHSSNSHNTASSPSKATCSSNHECTGKEDTPSKQRSKEQGARSKSHPARQRAKSFVSCKVIPSPPQRNPSPRKNPQL